jgi:hypothetical protein
MIRSTPPERLLAQPIYDLITPALASGRAATIARGVTP